MQSPLRLPTPALLCASALAALTLVVGGCGAFGAKKEAPPKTLADITLDLPLEPGPAAQLGFAVSWFSKIQENASGPTGHLRVLGDLVVAVETGGDRVTAIDGRSGQLRWIRRMGEELRPLLAPVRHGDHVFVNTESNLYRIHAATGRVGSTVHLAEPVSAEPAVLDDFLVFSGVSGGVHFFNLLTNYSTWEYRLPSTIRTHPVVFGKSAFAVDGEGKYAMLSVDRREVAWVGHTWGPVSVDPVLFRDILLVTSEDGSIYGVNRSTGHDMWRYADIQTKTVKNAPFLVPSTSLAVLTVEGEGLRILSVTTGTEVGRIKTKAVPVMATAGGKVIFWDKERSVLALVELPSGREILCVPTRALSRVIATQDGGLVLMDTTGQVSRLDPIKK